MLWLKLDFIGLMIFFFNLTLELFELDTSANLGHELLLNFQAKHGNLSGKLI